MEKLKNAHEDIKRYLGIADEGDIVDEEDLEQIEILDEVIREGE